MQRGSSALIAACLSLGCSSSDASPDGGLEDSAVQDSGGAGDATSDAPSTGDGAGSDAAASAPTMGGCPMFPPDYPYNQDISQAVLDPSSATIISKLKARAGAIVAEY